MTKFKQEYDHAHFFDLFGNYGSPQQDDVNFFLSYATRIGDALEIGAGTGRIAIRIAEHGIPVWTIEPSKAMRAIALSKILYKAHARPYLTVLGGDASTFKLKRLFKLIYAAGVYVHILSDAEHIAVLKNVHKHLADDGLFVFSLMDIDPALWIDHPPKVVDTLHIGEVEYRRIFGQEMLSENTCKYRTIYQAIHDGEVIERVENQAHGYFITREQMHDFLSQTGFEIINEYGDVNFTPFEEGSAQVIIEARKKT